MADVAEKVKQVIAEKLQIDAGQVTNEAAIVEDLGAEVTRHDNHSATLRAGAIRRTTPHPELFSHIRGALVLMGSMLAREGRIELPRPGGDQIGRRRIDAREVKTRRENVDQRYELIAAFRRGRSRLSPE